MTKLPQNIPEFSHPLSIDKIPAAGMEFALAAREKERKGLAERFGLLELGRLEAELSVELMPNEDAVLVTGTLSADVTQSCVATLEPLPATITREIETRFVPADMLDDNDETMEALDGKQIDLGELVAQHLAMALDPYPRKPGLPPVAVELGTPDKPDNPFVRLVKK